MRRVALHTLGCKLNYAETATIGRTFERAGYRVVHFDDPADVVVLNTCSVTERADRECRQWVRRALRRSPDAFVAVVGCYAQLRPQEIAAIGGVDLVAGSESKFDLVDLIGEGLKRATPSIVVRDGDTTAAIPATSAGSGRTRAFMKIQDGCDYLCTFCTIPKARGPSRSVPFESVLREASGLIVQGYREIVLTGVNTGDYGAKTGRSFLDVLRALTEIEGVERIRVSSIEPNLLDDQLLEFWIENPKVCKHWHIPLQSGSNSVLARMRRRYRAEWYADRVRRIREAVPDAGIGVDVIVGFPGESEAEFGETERLLKELPVSYLHVFSYSERPGTPAAEIESPVPSAVRAARSERLRQLSARKRRMFHERFVGHTVSVLVEGRTEQGWHAGLTEQYVRVEWEPDGAPESDVQQVLVVSANEETCVGRPVRSGSIDERTSSYAA
jgi:threonylcarbamoyladenosine tRNA methylthiotransferase MtaB